MVRFMLQLRFRVQGSAAMPYDLVAEGGDGISLRIHCSCPAGRRGGRFCKHAAALLLGDVTNLVEPSDDPTRLRDLAAGSGLIEAALAHHPADRRAKIGHPDFRETGDFMVDVAPARQVAEEKGWLVVTTADEMRCFGFTPAGRRHRSPRAWIKIDGVSTPNTPYHVTTPGTAGTTRNVKNLSYAVAVFIETLRRAREVSEP